MRRSTALIGLLAATVVALTTSADARTRRHHSNVTNIVVTPPQSGVQVGVLQCRSGQTVGYVVGSNTAFDCVFRANGRRPERYVAQISRVGLDLGITDRTTLVWSVFSPTRQFGAGDLSGNYGGVQSSATVGVGAGIYLLVGGSQNTFSLQPLSVQGQTGLSVAAGVAGLQLRPAG